jgi:hypothetical protein
MERQKPVDKAIDSLKLDLDKLRKTFSIDTDFRSKANWYENGEKPNKYFLNLNKFKQKQKLVSEISNNDKFTQAIPKSSTELNLFIKTSTKKEVGLEEMKINLFSETHLNCPKREPKN